MRPLGRDLVRRTDRKTTDQLMRGRESVVPQSAITVREHLELEIASQARHLESIIQNQARQLELQITGEVKRIEELRAATDLRYMQLRGADELALRAALGAAKEAVLKAEDATEKRLSLLNELRSGVATREQMQALEQRIADLKERVDKNEAGIAGRSGGLRDYIGWIIAIVTVIGFALAWVQK